MHTHTHTHTHTHKKVRDNFLKLLLLNRSESKLIRNNFWEGFPSHKPHLGIPGYVHMGGDTDKTVLPIINIGSRRASKNSSLHTNSQQHCIKNLPRVIA